MSDQPEVQQPAANTANDALATEAWYESHDMLSPMAADGTARVVGQIIEGAAKQTVEHPLETAGEVVAGAGAVAAGTYFGVTAAGAAAIAAVPAAGYGLYKGIDIAATEGISAIPGHLKSFYDETVQTIDSKLSAMQTVFTGDQKDPKLQTAKDEVQGIGAATVPIAAGLIGGSPTNGELGAQGIRVAVDVAKTTATEIARATLPLEPVPALVTSTMQTAKEVSSIAAGSPTLSPAITAQETAVFSQNMGGDGGGNESGSKQSTYPDGSTLEVFAKPTIVDGHLVTSVYKDSATSSTTYSNPQGLKGPGSPVTLTKYPNGETFEHYEYPTRVDGHLVTDIRRGKGHTEYQYKMSERNVLINYDKPTDVDGYLVTSVHKRIDSTEYINPDGVVTTGHPEVRGFVKSPVSFTVSDSGMRTVASFAKPTEIDGYSVTELRRSYGPGPDYSVYDNPDGLKGSGSPVRVIKFDDRFGGNIVETYSEPTEIDGHSVTSVLRRSDGSIDSYVREYPDGSRTVTSTDGTITSTAAGGTVKSGPTE